MSTFSSYEPMSVVEDSVEFKHLLHLRAPVDDESVHVKRKNPANRSEEPRYAEVIAKDFRINGTIISLSDMWKTLDALNQNINTIKDQMQDVGNATLKDLRSMQNMNGDIHQNMENLTHIFDSHVAELRQADVESRKLMKEEMYEVAVNVVGAEAQIKINEDKFAKEMERMESKMQNLEGRFSSERHANLVLADYVEKMKADSSQETELRSRLEKRLEEVEKSNCSLKETVSHLIDNMADLAGVKKRLHKLEEVVEDFRSEVGSHLSKFETRMQNDLDELESVIIKSVTNLKYVIEKDIKKIEDVNETIGHKIEKLEDIAESTVDRIANIEENLDKNKKDMITVSQVETRMGLIETSIGIANNRQSDFVNKLIDLKSDVLENHVSIESLQTKTEMITNDIVDIKLFNQKVVISYD
ncbi:unnamed protein product [Sphagnum tenellum]